MATGDARDREGEGKGDPSWIAICAETDTSASEQGKERKGGIFTRTPRPPDSQWRLPFIHVARAFNAVFSVFFVAPMDAIAADQTIRTGANRFHGIHGFDQNPYLNHVASLPIVAGFIESSGDDHTVLVFVENKAVAHRTPPSAIGTIERSSLVGTGFPSP